MYNPFKHIRFGCIHIGGTRTPKIKLFVSVQFYVANTLPMPFAYGVKSTAPCLQCLVYISRNIMYTSLH